MCKILYIEGLPFPSSYPSIWELPAKLKNVLDALATPRKQLTP